MSGKEETNHGVKYKLKKKRCQAEKFTGEKFTGEKFNLESLIQQVNHLKQSLFMSIG